jgi:Helix-turn-helix domain
VNQNIRWARALARSDLSSKAKHVAYVCALHYMNWQTLGDCRPGVPRLAKDASLSARTVQRALNELVEAGWLAIGKRGRSGRATLYYGTWPRNKTTDDDKHAGASDERCPMCGEGKPVVLVDGRLVCIPCSHPA